MDSELRQRLRKPPPIVPRYLMGVVNWVCMVAAAYLMVATLRTPWAGLMLVVFVLPVQVLSATLTWLFVGRHRLAGWSRRWMLAPVQLGLLFSVGTFVAAQFSTGSRC